MRIRIATVASLIFLAAGAGFALEPDEILIVANSDVAASVRIARYYCAKRGVPADNILALPLGTGLNETITRSDYEKQLAGPIRKKLAALELFGRIRCLLTTYGVPFRVQGRGPLEGQEDKLKQLKELLEREKKKGGQLKQSGPDNTTEQKEKNNHELMRLQFGIDRITGKETEASVDSELSMVLFSGYELYRWQPNELKNKDPYWDFKSLMVCRLDGPGEDIAAGLIDKAIAAEQNGLKGFAYIDSGYSAKRKDKPVFTRYDRLLRETALMIRQRSDMKVVEERTEKLFEAGACPRTAIYCGWYSLKKYVNAFDFVDGAIGYHIASLEAVDLRNPNSSQWCPAMLRDGITATLGAVAEPYLQSFPEPAAFFVELLDGRCLVEAYYRTKPFNSWQLILIGDPLYRPFKKP